MKLEILSSRQCSSAAQPSHSQIGIHASSSPQIECDFHTPNVRVFFVRLTICAREDSREVPCFCCAILYGNERAQSERTRRPESLFPPAGNTLVPNYVRWREIPVDRFLLRVLSMSIEDKCELAPEAANIYVGNTRVKYEKWNDI